MGWLGEYLSCALLSLVYRNHYHLECVALLQQIIVNVKLF